MRLTPTSIPFPDPVVVEHPVGSNTATSPADIAAIFRVFLVLFMNPAFPARVLGVGELTPPTTGDNHYSTHVNQEFLRRDSAGQRARAPFGRGTTRPAWMHVDPFTRRWAAAPRPRTEVPARPRDWW